jgi:two-component system, cell cycle sensor histidine kinase and response regulator CckA
MSEDRTDSDVLSELRRRAEERLQGQLANDIELTELSLKETRNLVHELRTHQIELEMQNEELRRIQDELVEARNRYEDLYDFAPVGYLTIGEKGIVEEANLAMAELLNLERGSLFGRSLSSFIIEEDQDIFYRHRREVLDTRERRVCEVRLKKEEGGSFWARLEIQVLAENAGVLRMAVSNIEDRRRMEEELVRSQRLRAVGELAAGVSHNLNNILTGILGPARMLQRMTDDPAQLREVEDIVTSGIRARDLVHRLHLSVHGEEDGVPKSVEIDPVVREVVQMMRPRWKDEPESRGIPIEMVSRLEGIHPIRATESRLHDILVNLLLNAVEAMPQGGAITLGTRAVEDQVELTCADTGIGMDEETRKRVFEPFFTTKMEVGTGLGLSTAHHAVTQWGGDAEVASTPGKGSVFTFRFPRWTG